jgi:hypothetical protein
MRNMLCSIDLEMVNISQSLSESDFVKGRNYRTRFYVPIGSKYIMHDAYSRIIQTIEQRSQDSVQ